MLDLFKKIKREIILRFFPATSEIKRTFLFEKYLKPVRFIGENVVLQNDTSITRPNGMVLGSEVKITGGGSIDATAGILIGDGCVIEKNLQLTTVLNDSNRLTYKPIIVGSGKTVATDLTPGTVVPNCKNVKGLNEYSGQIVFIVSTGRSGSKAIAELINQHPESECYHDSFPHIYSYSQDFLYEQEARDETRNKIETLYNSLDIGKGKVHGQSDQKLSPLIPILADLFPTSKFIWLVRKADSFVNSSYPRGWFDNSEFELPPNTKEFFEKKVSPSQFDAYHRTNGARLGVVSQEEWESMTAFERNCWYWSYWNEMIEKELNLLDKTRSKFIRLNELSNRSQDILDFLSLSPITLKTRRVNAAKYKKITREDWNAEMKKIYEKHCGENMKKWF